MGKRTLLTLAGIASLLVAAGAVHADLIASEDFAGYSTGDLDGQSTSSTTGFAGTETWSVSDDAPGIDGFEVESGSLNGPGLPEAGEKVKLFRGTNFDDGTGAEGTLVPSSPLTSTSYEALYFAALIDGDDLSDAHSLIVGWDHNVGSNDRIHGFEIRGSGDIYSLGNSKGGGENGDETNVDTGLDLASGVNLIVVRVTDKTGDDGSDEYDLWLNQTSEGTPDYSAPEAFVDGLVVNNGGYGFDGFYLKEAYDGENSALVDELLLGESFTDVVPEPATLALLGLGGLGMLIRRKRS